jgi:peptidyl-prolyl cis-trans isomerase SurA
MTGEVIDGIAAVVGDEPILISDIEEAIAFFIMQSGMEDAQADLPALKEEMLQSLINEKILLSYAEKESLAVSRSEVDRALAHTIDQIRARFSSEAAFLAELERENMTLEGLKRKYKENVRDQLLQQKFLESEIYPEIEITFREVREYYSRHRDAFSLPDQYHIQGIFLEPEIDDEHLSSVEKRLENIRSEAIADPLKFPELAERYSEDEGSATRGGNLGYIEKDALIGEFRRIVENLETGEISDVFRSQMGFHIVLLDGKDEEGYRLRHIMLKSGPPGKQMEKVRERATELREKLRNGKVTFSGAMTQYASWDDGRGDMDWFTESELPAGLKNVVIGLRPGEISEPVELEEGYVIIKLLEVRTGRINPLGEVESSIEELLKQEKLKDVLVAKLEELRKEIYVEVYVEFDQQGDAE